MLIGLNFNDEISVQEKTKITQDIAKFLGKRVKILNPTTRKDLVTHLSNYSSGGRTDIVLTNTHYKVEEDSSEGAFRVADYYFALRGGAVYGLDPERENNTYVYKVPSDLKYLSDNLAFLSKRAAFVRKMIPGYFGRTNGDPHTIIAGVKPSYSRLSKNLEQLITSFHEEWWAGVGFFVPNELDVANQVQRLTETFDYATILCCDPELAAVFDQENVRYTLIDGLTYKTEQEYEEAARKLRELSRLDQLIVLD